MSLKALISKDETLTNGEGKTIAALGLIGSLVVGPMFARSRQNKGEKPLLGFIL